MEPEVQNPKIERRALGNQPGALNVREGSGKRQGWEKQARGRRCKAFIFSLISNRGRLKFLSE